MNENVFLSVCISVYRWFKFFLINPSILCDLKQEDANDEHRMNTDERKRLFIGVYRWFKFFLINPSILCDLKQEEATDEHR
jgi:hypothetical protein